MPKLVVLYFGAESPAAALADAAAVGARGIRFTEVDVRVGDEHSQPTTQRHRRLESAGALQAYAGIVIACEAAAEMPTALDAVIRELEGTPPDTFLNTVFGVAGGENTVLAGRVAALGGIIVGEPRGATDPEVRARQLGARVAKVMGWVGHALGHEQGTADHHHDHP
ncbi:MAG TPA: hypothetical protein VL524_05780 [Gemmatimonadaceae bacterium]|jgi:hypothetical protein|nr:hypothetical protein [Gemmatimonadaceae bacterium]